MAKTIAKDVIVKITLTKAIPRLGFGYPLIFAGSQEAAVEYTEVRTLADVAAAGFAAETNVYKAAQLLLMQSNAPSKFAVCAATKATVEALPDILDKEWRQLIVIGGEGDSTIEAISDYIESCGKQALYFCKVASAAAVEAIEGNERTVAIAYTSTDVATPEAAIVGATAALDVGSFTYKNIALKGITAQQYTDMQVEDLHEAGVITYLSKAGYLVTSEGITVSGEFIDIVDSKDYIISQIEYQAQTLMIRVPKLPYDNRGISQLEGVVLNVLLDAAAKGMIAQNEDGSYMYSLNFLPRSECDPADISARKYEGGNFTFTLAGAIHNAEIHGEIIA